MPPGISYIPCFYTIFDLLLFPGLQFAYGLHAVSEYFVWVAVLRTGTI